MKQSSELSKYYVDNKYVFKVIDHLEYQIFQHHLHPRMQRKHLPKFELENTHHQILYYP